MTTTANLSYVLLCYLPHSPRVRVFKMTPVCGNHFRCWSTFPILAKLWKT